MAVLKRNLWLALLLVVVPGLGQGPVPDSPRPGEENPSNNRSREAWFRRGRSVPGQPAAGLLFQAYQQKMQLRGSGLSANAQTPAPTWQPLGPSPLASDASGTGQQDYGWITGRATAVAIDRNDPTGNTVYIGGAYGGVWKSSNAGAASQDPSTVIWTPLTDSQPTLAVGAIAIQPQSSNPSPSRSVVLVGTGETSSSTDSYYGLGILRSTDAGSTWTLIPRDATGTRSFAGLGFSKIAFSAANPNVVAAATAGASQGLIDGLANQPTANLGIYDSADGGVSWNYANLTDGPTRVAASSVASVVYNDGAGLFFAAVRFHGFYVSPDGGTWTRLANQPGPGLSALACPASVSSQNCPIYRGELAVVPGRNEMYAWYVDANGNDQGIWETPDGGNSWAQISTTSLDACGDNEGCGTENGAYNLTLAAVANGTATDLYAGAANIYKCSLNSISPTCSGPNTFLNLTHVFGCSPNFGSIAHVHPAQHAMDWLIVNGKALLYFANDGGIYRALDGYTGLTSGDCGSSNQFDSLNQTLGAMTQFVSFAQHPSDANTLLGGAQGNGSPATSEALVNSSWRNVNSGDGGFTAINWLNPTEWFTSNPGVNIQRCELGIDCQSSDFAANPIVSSSTLDGDQGPFYTPFILDPQNPAEMLVGSCRLWRGGTNGSSFSALSNNLDTGSPATCTGAESNLVRALAAGGPPDTNKFSQVIYAGTDGFGPSFPTVPAAGRVWVTQNSDGGTPTWFDRTSSINPQQFPISNIAMDSSDATGTTAYVSIMGFHVAHLWMTPSAGVSWFNFTANLPDAPVNAIVVDPGPDPQHGTVYVGTDVGVFASSTASPLWTEVGPAPNSGQTGFLPNVPVTALRIFSSGSTKLLRASTYGRGISQFPLSTAADYQLAVQDPIQTIFASQSATFTGILSGANGYNSPVNLSFVAGSTPLPGTCTVSPATITPGAQSQGLTVTASGVVGDYNFKLHAAGTDANHLAHDIPLRLHVVDFGLGAPTPSSVSVQQGATSSPISFAVTAQGSFQAPVDLSCTGLPAGASCNFSPASEVDPLAASPVSVSLTIATTGSTPGGTSPIAIHATTAGAPEKTQALSLQVGTQNYSIDISTSSATAIVNTPSSFTGTLSTASGFSSPVNLGCGTGAPPTCTVTPASLTPSTSGTPFSVNVSSPLPQSYNFQLIAQGTDALATVHTASLAFTATFDFSISPTPASQTVTAGRSASYSVDLNPEGGTFPASVAISCSGLPAKTSCALSSSQIAAGSPDTSVNVTISTTAATTSSVRPGTILAVAGLCLPVLGLTCINTKKHWLRRPWRVLAPLALTLGLLACGGGGLQGNGGGGGGGTIVPGTTPGQYLIKITATDGVRTNFITVTLVVQ